jgi:hypothetical protein
MMLTGEEGFWDVQIVGLLEKQKQEEERFFNETMKRPKVFAYGDVFVVMKAMKAKKERELDEKKNACLLT